MSEITPVKLVRVYNRSNQRTLTHEYEGTKYTAPPSAMTEVPEFVAKLWLKMFPEQIIDGGTAQRELGGAQAALNEAKLKLAEQEKELAALREQLAKKSGKPASAAI